MSGADGEILAEVRAGVATVTLNRPAALNALSWGMLCELRDWLDAWERDDAVRIIVLRGAGGKAFCAGGDVRALHQGLVANDPRMQEFFEVEYALDYRIHTYPKAIVALMDGIVMGGGMGLSQGARVRIVGDRTRMAMPETAIGLFPDVGGSYFLSRVPGELGTYLGLVGCTIGAADAIYCGLADVYAGAHEPPPRPELERLRPAIDRHFAFDSVASIKASLGGEHDVHFRPWAHRTLELLEQRSPTLLAVTLEQLRRGRGLSLADCFRMELNLIHGCFEHGDMQEGIRAVIVDKDNRPRWKPPGGVEAFFRPRWQPSQHPLASLR